MKDTTMQSVWFFVIVGAVIAAAPLAMLRYLADRWHFTAHLPPLYPRLAALAHCAEHAPWGRPRLWGSDLMYAASDGGSRYEGRLLYGLPIGPLPRRSR
jgi:hypothetical protein